MKRFVHPLLLLLARITRNEMLQIIEYLQAENRMLRDKLPKRIEVTPAERARLIKLGERLGSKIKHLITIVHPQTFARWLRESKSDKKPQKQGRPRKPEEIRQLVVEMAKSTGWGYRRIIGELRCSPVSVCEFSSSFWYRGVLELANRAIQGAARWATQPG